MKEIETFLDTLKVGRRQSQEALAIFPLMAPDSGLPDYLTLEEAISEGSVRITEASEWGIVPELRVVNNSPKAVLIVDGEELVGAKQNRIVNATFLIPGKTEVVIPVSCVEQGRWRYTTRSFSSKGRLMNATLRSYHQEAVAQRLEEECTYSSDQEMIWSELSAKAARMCVRAPTGAMADLFESHRDRLKEYTSAFRLVECQVGAVFSLGGRIMGFECFFYQDTFSKFFDKLLLSYALDALDYEFTKGKGPRGPNEAPKALIQAIMRGRLSEYPAIGLGRSVRIKADGVFGAALVEGGRVLHINAFTNEGPNGGRKMGLQRFSQRRTRAQSEG